MLGLGNSMCCWLHLESKNSPEHFCTNEGHPYCDEHTKLLEYLRKHDEDFEIILETHEEITADPLDQKPGLYMLYYRSRLCWKDFRKRKRF